MDAKTLHIVVCLVAGLATIGGGQEAGTPEAPPVQLTLDLGFVDAAGNSDVTTFNLGEKITWRLDSWAFSQTAKAIYGESAGDATAESYEAGLRADRTLTPRVAAFAFVSYQRDPFAGVAARWSGGPGLAFHALRTSRDTLTFEGSVTAQNERNTAGVGQAFAAVRTAGFFKHMLGTAAFVSQTLEWLANLETADDQRVNSETALIAPLSRQIALRVAYLIRFDNLPEPGFERTDRIFTTGIQIAL
jgi:putative salt-induced outer membrane protein